MTKNAVRFFVGALLLLFPLAASNAGPIFLAPIGNTKKNAPVIQTLPVKPDAYLWPSMENLSKLYWALGMFDPNDEQAIDNFLFINECHIYKNYYNNDIEWAKIRAATAADIAKSEPTYPTRFEVILPLLMGRYNQNEGYFEVTPDTSIEKTRRFEMSPDRSTQICGRTGEITGYPRGLIVNLDQILTIRAVPMKPAMAQLFMHDGPQRGNRPRVAYLRLMVHVTQHIGTQRFRNGSLGAAVFCHLDGLQFYADPNDRQLLYSLDAKPFQSKGAIVMTPSEPDPLAPQELPPQVTPATGTAVPVPASTATPSPAALPALTR